MTLASSLLARASLRLSRIDWRAMAELRAEIEARVAEDERRALAMRAEVRAANRPNKSNAAELTLSSSSETIALDDRKPSRHGGIVSHDGSTVALETYGAATPTKLGASPSEPPPGLLQQVGEAFAVSGDK